MELLDSIMIVTNCERAEQLKDLSPERKLKLAQTLEKRVPSGLASVEEWNELLMLFMGTPPERKNKIAKKKLLCYLRGEEYQKDPAQADKNKWLKFKNKQ